MNDEPHPLATAIETSQMSRADVCEALEISAPYLSQVLSRKRGVTLELALKIQKLFGEAVPLESLVAAPRPHVEAAE